MGDNGKTKPTRRTIHSLYPNWKQFQTGWNLMLLTNIPSKLIQKGFREIIGQLPEWKTKKKIEKKEEEMELKRSNHFADNFDV